MKCLNLLAGVTLALSLLTLNGGLAVGQDQSVKPGINDSYRNPNPVQFVERFEIESREVFHHREAILEACRIEAGTTIADIGSGTGLFTRLFSKAVGSNGHVIAVDIAQEFLDHIMKTNQELGLKNVTTLRCTPDSTELPENSIDVAFICDVYHHFEFPYKTMASLHRALKPGGRVIVIDFHRIEGKSTEWILNHVRAGQDVVENEIKQSGLRKVRQWDGPLQENYFVEFQKVVSPAELKSSIIPNIGGAAELSGAPNGPRPGAQVVFEVTAGNKIDELNAGLERAARLLNIYGAEGLDAANVEISIVLHGEAAKAAIQAADSLDMKHSNSPNRELIGQLQRAGVNIMVCGQTLARNQIPQESVLEGVTITTSAMTALINLQLDGAALMSVQ